MESPDMEQGHTVRSLEPQQLGDFADLYISGIPNAIFAALGRNFVARFFGQLAARPDVCAFVGLDARKRVVGVIAGTLNRSASYGGVLRANRWSLFRAAGFRSVSPRVVRWIAGRLLGRLRLARHVSVPMPDAELLVISICPEARGTGLARRLISAMDDWFAHHGFEAEYTILTETANARANAFYKSIGARLIAEGSGRRAINSYVRQVPPRRVSEERREQPDPTV